MIALKIIDKSHENDINIKNEPFKLFGRMRVTYSGGRWTGESELFSENDVSEMTFPDENYSFDEMFQSCIFLGAYDGEKCIGLAILEHRWNKYLYLYDLKVNGEYRGKGIGRALIGRSLEAAREYGYIGLHTVAQDNNLAACRFYLRCGFEIGGIDTRVYDGTSQQGKSDILLYLK